MASNQMPKKANYTLCSTFPTFREFAEVQDKKIIDIVQNVFAHKKFPHNITK